MDTEIPKKPIAFLKTVSAPFTSWALIATVAVICAASIGALDAYIVRRIIDAATTEGSSSALFWVLLYPVSILIGALCWRLSGVTGSRWIIRSEALGYKRLFAYMSKHSQTFFDNRFAGSLISAIGTATSGTSTMIEMYLWRYLDTLIGLLVSFILVATTSMTVAGIFAAWVVALIPINYALAKRKTKLSEAEATAQNELRGNAIDATSNMSIVHLFARRSFEVTRLDEALDTYKHTSQKSWNFSEGMLAINNVLLALFVLSVVLPTFFMWQSGAITAGQLVMVVTLVASLLHSFTFIGNSMNYFAKTFGEVRKGLEDILHPHGIVSSELAHDLVVTEGAISFEQVSFQYNEQKGVLNDITLRVAPGERVGIVGPSGAGKTTLIRLLLRQHDIADGTITIDYQDISQVTLESLRATIGIVPQEPLLFHRTIKENILYGHLEATDEDVIRAATLAQAHEFISSFPDGYNTIVGERGVKLSAGQRQRIAIARAILKDAPILILDEATSALDSESEVAIQKALETLMHKKTVLAVAHRLSTLREMDRIIVLKDGAIVEDGSHTALMKKRNGIYATLWKHQAGGFIQDEASN